MTLQNLPDNPEGPLDPGKIYRELYRAEETLYGNELFWWLEKHRAANRSKKRASEYISLWYQLQKEAVERVNRHKIDAAIALAQAQTDAEIAREKARNNDAIAEEQLWKRMDMLTNVLTHLDQPLPDKILENLPDDARVELISSVFEKLLGQIFSDNAPVQSNSNLDVSQDLGRKLRLIDADEF